MFANTNSEYPIALLKSIGRKSFEALGRAINKSSKYISRLLCPSESNLLMLERIACQFFKNQKELILVIDDTLIKKIYSKFMRGSGKFYDTKICRTITAFRLLCCGVTDGKNLIPIGFSYLFSSEFVLPDLPSKNDLVKQMILHGLKIFPNKKITVAADGAFASKDLLGWCIDKNIATEMRMHSNRKVEYKGQPVVIRKIKELQLTGRRMARTIQVKWHGMDLFITAQRRIDKHREETIVYQVSTYKAKPAKHVSIYKKRWPIEKMFRTTKQSLGLSDCFSLKLDVQKNHTASVFLAYALAQVEQKIQKLPTPEDAIRWLKSKKVAFLKRRIHRLDQIFGGLKC